jgi:hypothetical protein
MPDARSRDPALESSVTPRRTFVARVVGVMAAWPVLSHYRSRAGIASSGSVARVPPNATLLGALGEAVLPAELGAGGIARAVADFERWMQDYQPGAELNHGYGTGKIDRLTADPRPQWRAQLASLETEAKRAGAPSFAALPREARQAIVRTALASERGDSLPSPLAARHVALALLAHFYDSPAATDLCYDAQIGRQQCRPLAAQRQQPLALARRRNGTR